MDRSYQCCYLFAFFPPRDSSLDMENRNPNKTIFYLSHSRTRLSNSPLSMDETPQSQTVTVTRNAQQHNYSER